MLKVVTCDRTISLNSFGYVAVAVITVTCIVHSPSEITMESKCVASVQEQNNLMDM